MISPASRPILMLIAGGIVDFAIANHWLYPQERDTFVNGAVSIIGAGGTVLLLCISLWNEYARLHKAEARGQVLSSSFSFLSLPSSIMSFIFKAKGQAVDSTTTITSAPETEVQPAA